MHATVTFDATVFSLLAVKKAAYKYMSRLTADIRVDAHTILCDLTFPPSFTDSDKDLFIADFRKEVLDQDLREQLARETEAVRNLILAHAFSQTGLVQR